MNKPVLFRLVYLMIAHNNGLNFIAAENLKVRNAFRSSACFVFSRHGSRPLNQWLTRAMISPTKSGARTYRISSLKVHHLLSDVEADDLSKIDLRIIYLRRAEFSCWNHRLENGCLGRPCFD